MTNPNPTTKSCVFEAGKTYRTTGGDEALIYCTDAPGDFPIHGRIGGGWLRSWDIDGRYERIVCELDLIPPAPPRIREKRWVNVYPDGPPSDWDSEKHARQYVGAEALRTAVPCELVEIVGEEAPALESPAPEPPKLLSVGTRVRARARGIHRTIARMSGALVEVDTTALPYRVWFTEGPNDGHRCWCSADEVRAAEGEGV